MDKENNYKIVKFKDEDFSLDVYQNIDDGSIWLNRKQISILYERDIKTIGKHISIFIKNNEENKEVVAKFATTGTDGKTYQVEYYNQVMIIAIGYRVKSKRVYLFKEWYESLLNSYKDNYDNQNTPIFSEKYEVIKFIDGEFNLDVNVSPSEDTVWLTRDQIAELYDRDRTVISKHIKNIFDNFELEKDRCCAKNALHLSGGRIFNVDIYNLDVIFAVGYRVNSKRAIQFRNWASSILKKYLINGYSINEKRCLERGNVLINLFNDVSLLIKDNNEIKNKYSDIVNNIDDILNRLKKVEENFKDETTYKHFVFFKGQKFEADIKFQDIYSKAKNTIIVIDDYVGIKTLQLLRSANPNVLITIITDNKAYNGLNKNFIKDSKLNLRVKKNNDTFHDRYIVIDYKTLKEQFYHSGSSSKDSGSKIAAIDDFKDGKIYYESIDNILSQDDYIFNE